MPADNLQRYTDNLQRYTLMSPDERATWNHQAAQLMERQGGGFAAALAGAYFRADLGNQARILQAFGDLFAEYRDQAAGVPEFRRDTWTD